MLESCKEQLERIWIETAARFQDGRRLRCNVVSLPGPKGPPPSIPPQAG